MGATGTRPPLFDPEPGGFDGDQGGARQQFPGRGTGSGTGYPRNRSGSSSSPRWVRPFIMGGLVLIAVVSLASILGGGGEEGEGTPVAVDPVETAAPEAPVAPVAAVGDDGVAGEEVAATEDALAVDADPDVVEAEQVGTAPAAPSGPAESGPWTAADLQSASAFGVQFANDYLNYDPDLPDVRERNLRAYLAPGLDPQLGWDGQGAQAAVLITAVAAEPDDDRVVVTLAANVTGSDAPRWIHLAVPLARDEQARWAVVRPPAYVPRPAAGNPPDTGISEVDQQLSSQLTPAMADLFSAYATDASVAVGGVTAPGSTIRGLQGQVTFVEVDAVRIAAGDDTGRRGTVTVTWEDPVTGGSIVQDYAITLTVTDGSWLVEQVRSS